MKILVLTQYYAPENVPIPEQIAQGLAERGHDVEVLTTFPSYPRGKIFDGFRQSRHHVEVRNGIRVNRVRSFLDHSAKPVRRALSYASFGVSSATSRQLIDGADVVYVYATQLTAACGPWLWRLFGSTPYVLHIQDLWPDSVIGSSLVRSSIIKRMVGGAIDRWAARVYRRSSGVVAIAPTMADLLEKRGASGRVQTVFNWTNESHPPVPRTGPSAEQDSTEILYAGNIGDMQNLEIAIEAAHRTADEGVKLRLVGSGMARERVEHRISELGAQNVSLEGPVSPSMMPALYANADFSLVSLKSLDVFHATIPSKFQSALFHGTPVIAAVPGDLAGLVEEREVGIVADPSSVDSLSHAFRKATKLSSQGYEAMRQRCRSSYQEVFSLGIGLNVIEAVLTKAARSEGERS